MNKMNLLGLFLLPFILFTIGCELFDSTQSTKSSSGSSSTSKTTSLELPGHGQATVNLLERAPFQGRNLDPAFWTNMEAYCKAGPTQLIIADMSLVLNHMTRAGFTGRENAQYFALSRTINGAVWNPGSDGELQSMKNDEDQIYAWWNRYVQAVVQIMQKAPQTTVVIIVNDGHDRCGNSLGKGTYRMMSSVISRVSMGSTVPD
jgi:hypothetical protein